MAPVSLTRFVDFVSKSGTPKLTLARTIASQGEYSPAEDFWRRARLGIVDFHRDGRLDKMWLDRIATGLTDGKKKNNYPKLIKQYKRFLGKKQHSWFEPPSAVWSASGLDVRVNPELGLVIDGEPHVIKLYLKGVPLTKAKSDMVLLLMEQTLSPPHGNDAFAILDVQKSRLFASKPDIALAPLLAGEAASLASMLETLS